ncbi:MAG: hypothetical protein M1497_09285, partial [Nitrospirae bacterium]|nr:hypothetical protein [Nitrospirota bacterium]
MKEPVTVCSLEYLTGTLATAYKGLITSLVAKDFCMTREDDVIVLKGTVLSMPERSYQAVLKRGGLEASKVELRSGSFELRADSALVGAARNLQIDITQGARHIGTFLLKKEREDECFVSAMELSEELRGVNFRRLTFLLEEKPGLLKAAEEIVAAIASAKKDLKKLSEAIRRFSKDLFWYVRDSYSAWFGVLVAYSIKACDRPEATFRERAVANVLSLIELPLESDSDSERVRMPAEIWLRETGASSVPLGYRFLQARRVLTQIHERFPGADAEAAMQALLFSLRGRVTAMPALNDRILKALGEHIGDEDLLLLSKYGERNRQELVSRLAAAEAMVRNKEVPAAFEVLGDIGAVLESEGGMADTFFGVVQRNIAAPSARRFSAIVYEALSLQEGLPRETYERMIGGVTGFVRYLLAGGMVDACADLLARIREGRLALREKIVLAPGIASAILNSGTGGLLESYADIVKEIVIPAPAITGFSDETWAEIVNPLHIERLSSLLGIISLDSIAFREVLVRVICNLFLTGVFIPDEKIFQREVSSYLNSAAPGKDFLLHYLLLKRLPVYHSEVGAAGRIRELTTEIDMWSNDQVLYFLRKQTHANASNLNIRLVGEIITSWVRNDAGPLGQVVPGDVMQRVNADLLAQYHAAIRPFFESVGVLDTGGLRLERIVAIPGADLERKLKEQGLSEEIQRKVFLICRIYQEIVRKYSPSAGGAGQGDPYTTLARSLSVMGELKARIVSPAKTAATESLYFKRHIAFGIPSVMGTYHEPKFDAMGELLRKEEEFRAQD